MYSCRFKKCYLKQNYDTTMLESISENSLKDTTNNDNNSCNCGFEKSKNTFPENPILGQSYVPIQQLDKTFMPCVGLKKGTLFPELEFNYEPNQSIEENAFIKDLNSIKEGCNKC